MNIEKKLFGNTGIEVSRLGFGAGHIGDPAQPEKEIENLLNKIVDSGINLIDTARAYGLSEERIGKYLSHRRDEIVLSTKIGYGIPGFEDWTGPCISAGVDAALARLRTEYIDIVHFHSCPVSVLQREDVMRALEHAVSEGKIRVPAYSGDNEALAFAIQTGVFKSIQTSINICDQHAIDQILPEAKRRGMGVIAKRPVANAPWRFREQPFGHYCETYWVRLRDMGLAPDGYPLQEMALRFAAYTTGVDSCIIGTANPDHLLEDLEIVRQGPLPDDLYESIRISFRRCDNHWPQMT